MIIAGVDEAGRGALAGPVVAAAVILPENLLEICPQEILKNIKDSKKIPENLRKQVFLWLSENVIFGIGTSFSSVVDEKGIKKANFLAMKSAIDQLSVSPEKILVDGNDGFIFSVSSEDIIKGDEKELSISAASIFAKVSRDFMMKEYAKKFPHYGFEEHKGYGTKKHLDAIEQHGICEIHRKTYDPIPEILYQQKLF